MTDSPNSTSPLSGERPDTPEQRGAALAQGTEAIAEWLLRTIGTKGCQDFLDQMKAALEAADGRHQDASPSP
jgi:hypothetical protein